MNSLEDLSRREVQALCKEQGIKAGGKTADLIVALSELLAAKVPGGDKLHSTNKLY